MNLEPETVLNIFIILAKSIYLWPLDLSWSKQLRIVHKFVYYFCIINEVLTIILLLATIKYSIPKGDYHTIIESLSVIGSATDALVNWFLFKHQQSDLNELLRIFTKYVRNATGSTKKILQRYMNNYLLVYPLAIILFFATVISFICTPIFTEKKFPLPFYYLSTIEKYSINYYLIFIWHFWIMSQSLVTVFMCFVIPILISMISTKLDILALQLVEIKNQDQLKVWIQKHQKCIRHATNIKHILSFMILKLYVVGMMTIIFGALPILYYRSTIEFIRATLYVGVSLILVYIVIWGADDMHRAVSYDLIEFKSSRISQEIFNSDWQNMPIVIKKSIIIIICRAQKPLDISIHGVLPALTLNFFAKFLSYALSYIMTLRAILL